jgi:hypothetical protein
MKQCILIISLTDTASYSMIKAGMSLKIFYTNNMIYLTCTAHVCNRLSEKIKEFFPKVNNLIN